MTFEEKFKKWNLLGTGKTQLPERLNKCRLFELTCSLSVPKETAHGASINCTRRFGANFNRHFLEGL